MKSQIKLKSRGMHLSVGTISSHWQYSFLRSSSEIFSSHKFNQSSSDSTVTFIDFIIQSIQQGLLTEYKVTCKM